MSAEREPLAQEDTADLQETGLEPDEDLLGELPVPDDMERVE